MDIQDAESLKCQERCAKKQYSWLVFCQNVNYIWVRNPMIVSEREEDNGLDCINMQNYFFYS